MNIKNLTIHQKVLLNERCYQVIKIDAYGVKFQSLESGYEYYFLNEELSSFTIEEIDKSS